MLAVRRALREDYLINEAPRLNGIFGVAGTTFAVVLAFVVLSTFQSYQRAQGGAEAEAVAVLELTRTTHFLPGSIQTGLQGQLRLLRPRRCELRMAGHARRTSQSGCRRLGRGSD